MKDIIGLLGFAQLTTKPTTVKRTKSKPLIGEDKTISLEATLLSLSSVTDGFIDRVALVHDKKYVPLFKASPKMLKAIVNFKTDMYGRGCDCDPEMIDLLEKHLSVFTEIIEDISGKTWEELIK